MRLAMPDELYGWFTADPDATQIPEKHQPLEISGHETQEGSAGGGERGRGGGGVEFRQTSSGK